MRYKKSLYKEKTGTNLCDFVRQAKSDTKHPAQPVRPGRTNNMGERQQTKEKSIPIEPCLMVPDPSIPIDKNDLISF